MRDYIVVERKELEEKHYFEKYFNVFDQFIIVIDTNGKVIFVNETAESVLQHDQDELAGRYLPKEIISSKSQKAITDFLAKSVDGQEGVWNTPYTLNIKNGVSKEIDARTVAIKDESGQVVGIMIKGADMAKPQDAFDLKNDIYLYRLLANNLPDINLFLFDLDFKFLIAEGAEMKNMGLKRSDFEGKKLTEIKNKKLKDIWLPLFESAIGGEEIKEEYKLHHYYYTVWVLPIKNAAGKVYQGITITQNVTANKRVSDRLRKSRDAAEKANRIKSEFMANMSHEIRTPLNAILGFTEQMLQTDLDKKQEDFLKVIDKSSEHLLSLVNDILILSSVEAQKISLDNQPFKVKNTAKYLSSALSMKAKEKGLKFRFDIDERLDMVLLGDAFRLRQILMNFLGNAIKFTESGYVELKAMLWKEEGDEILVRFDVIDTGIGISSENLDKIFDQFQQGDSRITKKYGGTGLGLTICKNLIKLQNGTLSVSSQEGIGSTFSFTIPYKKGKDLKIADDAPVDYNLLKNHKVLLVDDDSVNRLLGKTILDKLELPNDIAIGGQEAINKLAEEDYDIILLDIHMPDVSGIDVAKYIRYEKNDQNVKIIAVTADVVKNKAQTYFDAGIDNILIKPYKEINLYNKLQEVLSNKDGEEAKENIEIILKEYSEPKSYNLKELITMAGGSSDFIMKMLDAFIVNSKNSVARFKKNLEIQNWDEIGEAAHKIIPAFRHLEINGIVPDLLKIKENTIVNPNYQLVPELVENTIEKIEHIINDLREEREYYSKNKKP